jgi:hypothetical protein
MHKARAKLATLSAASNAGPNCLIAGNGEGRKLGCVVSMLIKISKTRADTVCDTETWAATSYGCWF